MEHLFFLQTLLNWNCKMQQHCTQINIKLNRTKTKPRWKIPHLQEITNNVKSQVGTVILLVRRVNIKQYNKIKQRKTTVTMYQFQLPICQSLILIYNRPTCYYGIIHWVNTAQKFPFSIWYMPNAKAKEPATPWKETTAHAAYCGLWSHLMTGPWSVCLLTGEDAKCGRLITHASWARH